MIWYGTIIIPVESEKPKVLSNKITKALSRVTTHATQDILTNNIVIEQVTIDQKNQIDAIVQKHGLTVEWGHTGPAINESPILV